MSHQTVLVANTGESTAKIVNRILSFWDRATDTNKEDGAQWYPLAGQIARDLATETGTSLEVAAVVIAHMSPRTTWTRNVLGAQAVLAGSTDRNPHGCMASGVERARAAMVHLAPITTLNGKKVRRFAANIMGDQEYVTIDVWAVRIALADRDDAEKILGRANAYEALQHCYRLAARRRGVTPATMQATTWIVARNGRAN